MSRSIGVLPGIACVIACVLPVSSYGQSPSPPRGRLIVTVADPSGAIVADATVTLTGLEASTKATPVAPARTNEKGVATFEGLVLGRYSISAEFTGFELGLLRDIKISRGDNKHVVVLPLRTLSTEVTVGRDSQEQASSRASLGSALTREQVEALSDDPDEMRRQLAELAGPNATIRVDSFEGQQLPPKAQIKSIHITRDQWAAENHHIGGLFVDIITQPGMGPLRGNGFLGYNSSALNGRTEFTPRKGPEQNRNFNFGFGGTIVPRKLDASLGIFGTSNYSTPNTYFNTGSGTRAETLNVRTPTGNLSLSGTMNWAVTRDQTIRLSGNVGGGKQENLGVGGFDLLERTYATTSRNYGFLVQEAGPLGRRFFINTRMRVYSSRNSALSTVEAPTIVVHDAFTSGGAQRAGETRSRGLMMQSDLDYVRGINSWRVGIQLDGSWYRSDDTSNYLGTYTFTSLDAFDVGRPTYFTRRIGDPLIQYSNVQLGVYLQDDIRISKSLTLSPGLRYEVQTHVTDRNGLGPRFGFTWSPFKSGKTTIRGGGGVAYEWLSTGTYAQTVRLDGFHQQELTIANPTYPDPGDVGTIMPTSRYLLGADYVLPRNVGMVIGVDQTITPRLRASFSYNMSRLSHVARGRNLNAPAAGVRPDPKFLNIIETVSDAAARSHSMYGQLSMSLLPPSPANNQARFNWKRMSVNAFYSSNRRTNNSDGAFSVPASGTLATEWGPAMGSRLHSVNLNVNSSALKNMGVGLSLNLQSGAPYNVTTGFDENGDLFFNDRPSGVGRNSAREAKWQKALSARLSYSFTFGKAASSAPPGIMISGGPAGFTVTSAAPPTSRYRVSIIVMANNLTNRSNYGGYSGVMTSPFFGLPTTSGMPRRITLQLNFGF